MTRGHGSLTIAAAIAAVVLGLPPAASATDFTWSGGAGDPAWIQAANWAGNAAPNGTTGTLSFPALTSAACTAVPQTATCYTSNNNLGGLSPNAISIDDGVPYNITGSQTVTLGAGGLMATPSSNGTGPYASWNVPLLLGADQAWSITGGAFTLLFIGAPVTGAHALAVNFTTNPNLELLTDVEVGAVTVSGSGRVILGPSGSLNGTDASTVSFSGAAGLLASSQGNRTGPLTMTGGALVVGLGGASPDGTLAVNGDAALSATDSVALYINQAGMMPATDYSQLTVSGTLNLGSAHLELGGVASDTGSCPALNPGDVDTIVTAAGGLGASAFAGVPDGTTLTLSCRWGTAPTIRINYTATAVTATVLTGGGRPTTTSLAANPATTVTNEAVTLTATVGPDSPATRGSVSFNNGGVPIAGCAGRLLLETGPTLSATCKTSFAAASSAGSLSATFTPSSGTGLQGSSGTASLTIGRDSTGTDILAPAPLSTVGTTVTFTALVSRGHDGPAVPNGAVRFLDGGATLADCKAQPVSNRSPHVTVATCTLTLGAAGRHSISATYLGDANFAGSTSSARGVTVLPSSAQIEALLLGEITPVGRAGKIGSILRHHGYLLPFTAPEAGTVTIQWYFVPHGAHLTNTGHPVPIASDSASFAAAGAQNIEIALTPAGKRKLKRSRSINLKAKAVFDRGGGSAPVVAIKTFRLRR